MCQSGLVGAVLASAARGHAGFDPIGGAIGGSRPRGVHIGLHQPGRQAITLPPVPGDPPRQLSQDMGGQMLHSNRGQDQETAVADDPGKVRVAHRVVPPQPFIAGGQPPGAGTDGQAAKHATLLADDQVADLRPAQRAAAKWMVRIHQGIPGAAFVSPAADRLQLYRSQFRQRRRYLGPDRRWGLCEPRSRLRPSRRRQNNRALPLQLHKRLAAGHLLRPPENVHPVQPGAGGLG